MAMVHISHFHAFPDEPPFLGGFPWISHCNVWLPDGIHKYPTQTPRIATTLRSHFLGGSRTCILCENQCALSNEGHLLGGQPMKTIKTYKNKSLEGPIFWNYIYIYLFFISYFSYFFLFFLFFHFFLVFLIFPYVLVVVFMRNYFIFKNIFMFWY